jgi:hypothetical protein
MTKEFNLAGKDWFTEPEAAHYCGVSLPQFRNHYEELGITPRKFMGRKLYSREELSAVISRSNPWHQHTQSAADRQSFLDAIERGRKEANAAARQAKKLAQGGTVGGPPNQRVSKGEAPSRPPLTASQNSPLAPYQNLTAQSLRPYKPRKKAGP